ncbi:Rne/Rng family ribonuclease [Mesobaculum littorinae]|uniref:Ribonuclease E n=1 Tax=Mesobaculum littorinae TaxID=2486419 RepID=A0A438AKZ3_9RHOB|nr:ribonuclease E/G [Mesobaculum littorinae]RVV99493.1 Rne/Rng family ribonuclease [Mesobaculum littorinae]
MPKKMLIDATHAEETRVVVVDGNKVEEFDFESENRRQLAGNIYLAKVTRVEPSLQAAFVDYGGNRHGFLAFSEIHPDYYQIPVADREALLAEEAELAAREDDEDEKPKRRTRSRSKAASTKSDDAVATAPDAQDGAASESGVTRASDDENDEMARARTAEVIAGIPGMDVVDLEADDDEGEDPVDRDAGDDERGEDDGSNDGDRSDRGRDARKSDGEIESVATEDVQEEIRQPRRPRARKYKIQEVVKVRQILLVQVVKEERGNKGAALTTYLSLAGRYCVLMPNTARGGGISRKITNAADRKKLKEIAGAIDVPKGAGLIIRTAGAQRTRTEIKRDYEYLQRMWEQIRELTLRSIAPAKIYEEGDLIKRSIRDLYNREIDEVFVEGPEGYRTAKDFMKMIMPSHAKNVKHYQDQLPLFARYQVESYLSAMFNPTVQLKSGGYIVIGVTEALVAIDVNSGRATKEGSIEETALKTNLEAAEEVARQLRLRDLAGLIVIDFIDMEERKNNAAVEKRFKEKLKTDRARIQVGRISGFGLMEMSRQRLRPGMLEATTQPCQHCHGTGLIRSDDNLALGILRAIEEEGVRGRSREVLVKAPVAISNYLINQKRDRVAQVEARYGLSVRIEADPLLISPDFSIEKFKTATRVVEQSAPVVSADASLMREIEEEEAAEAAEAAQAAEAAAEAEADAPAQDTPEVETQGEDSPQPKKRRRRRRRKKSNGNGTGEDAQTSDETGAEANGAPTPGPSAETESPAHASAEAPADQAADQSAETQPEAAEAAEPAPKPKRTRRRSSKKVAEPATAEQSAEMSEPVALPPEAMPPVQEPAAAKAEAATAKGHETGAEASAPASDEQPVAEAPAPAATPAPVPEKAPAAPTRAAATPAQPVDATPAETPDPQPVRTPEAVPAEAETAAETPAETRAEPSEEAPKPKKRGWWSLGI